MTATDDERRSVLTVGEAATLLLVDAKTLKRWLAAGKLRGFKTPGGHWRVSDPEVLKLWNAGGGGGA